MAQQGEVALGARMVSRAIEANAGWKELLARLGPEIAPGAEAVREVLGAKRPGR